jgi:hypothetical protein
MSFGRDLDRGAATGALIIGTVASGIFGAVRASAARAAAEKDERKRQKAISDLFFEIALNNPAELTDELKAGYTASNFSSGFDEQALVRGYYVKKLYLFLLDTYDERFADDACGRLTKFLDIGVPKSLAYILQLTLDARGISLAGEALADAFQDYLKKDDTQYRERGRKSAGVSPLMWAYRNVTPQAAFAQLLQKSKGHITQYGLALTVEDGRCFVAYNGALTVHPSLDVFLSTIPRNRKLEPLTLKEMEDGFSQYGVELLQKVYGIDRSSGGGS